MRDHVDIDPYTILGVSSDSSPEEIKSAYRRAARRLHPDVNQHNPGANVQFQDITVAHEILSDPGRKRAYDEKLQRQRSDDADEVVFSLRVTPSRRSLT